MSTLVILGVIGVAFVLYGVMIYNKLIRFKNHFRNAYSQIDVQLQRRHELIPNLVEIARGYLKHEQQTLVAVTEARNAAASCSKDAAADPGNPGVMQALAKAESQLAGAMGKLNVVMEAYPELKADERMQDLHDELTSTENRVGYARQAYSDAVMRYNAYREQFPPVIVAQLFSFKEADLFAVVSEEIKQPVSVSFDQAA
ncbi:MAG: LemA family protein [Gammaproteobacteria bacterium]|nr:LemA family protein [Gammaproteobacteria bacterium]